MPVAAASLIAVADSETVLGDIVGSEIALRGVVDSRTVSEDVAYSSVPQVPAV